MKERKRFQDKNYRLTYFEREVLSVCPVCEAKAIATVDIKRTEAKFVCVACGYNKHISFSEYSYFYFLSANTYFNAELWLSETFRDKIFYAYNYEHLNYLEEYIAADLREHKDREYFTLLEKLPRWYHEAKNREALLKIISKLKMK